MVGVQEAFEIFCSLLLIFNLINKLFSFFFHFFYSFLVSINHQRVFFLTNFVKHNKLTIHIDDEEKSKQRSIREAAKWKIFAFNRLRESSVNFSLFCMCMLLKIFTDFIAGNFLKHCPKHKQINAIFIFAANWQKHFDCSTAAECNKNGGIIIKVIPLMTSNSNISSIALCCSKCYWKIDVADEACSHKMSSICFYIVVCNSFIWQFYTISKAIKRSHLCLFQ